MIRLATVFSGIGAIEHALNRMNIDNKIIFACDNGDVDILTKNIGMNLDVINSELRELTTIIENIQFDDEVELLYKNQLNNMLQEANNEYINVIVKIGNQPKMDVESLKMILKTLVATEGVKTVRVKEYSKFLVELTEGTEEQQKLKQLQTVLKLITDYKKDNDIELLNISKSYKSRDGIKWEKFSLDLLNLYKFMEKQNGRKTVRKVQDLSQRTSQLHEKINYLQVNKKLESMGSDWKCRKQFVDSLYEGLEKRNKVKQSYMANYHLDDENFHWNVAFLDGHQYKGKVDLFVGGSPCQSFSLVGKQRGLEDTRGTLFYEYARLIDEIKPKVFIYENVRAVISNDEGRTWKKMKEVFSELGYDFDFDILNARNYGIPQNRERLFVVGFRKDLKLTGKFEFPKPVELTKKMQDFLMDNAPGGYFLPKKGVEFVTKENNLQKKFTQIDGEIQLCQKKNQQFNWHGDFVFQSEDEAKNNNIPDLEKYFLSEKVEKYVMSSGTKNFHCKPKTDLEVARPLLTTMHKMHRAGVDNYVTTDGRLRKLTPRECLRLMGFSDDFKIVVSDTAMYQQAGNSIVVDVLIHIMEEILKTYPNIEEE